MKRIVSLVVILLLIAALVVAVCFGGDAVRG
jgi:predicted small secreted protein